jgi:hypothetical protein
LAGQYRSTGVAIRHVHGPGSFPPRDRWMQRYDWLIYFIYATDHIIENLIVRFTFCIQLNKLVKLEFIIK